MPNLIDQIRALHAAYQARTGYQVSYNLHRENVWGEWLKWSGYQWTEKELARVIGYLRAQIRNGSRNEGALKFSNLIGDPEKFEEDLLLAQEASKSIGSATPRRHSPAQPATPEPTPEEAEKLRAEMKARIADLRRL